MNLKQRKDAISKAKEDVQRDVQQSSGFFGKSPDQNLLKVLKTHLEGLRDFDYGEFNKVMADMNVNVDVKVDPAIRLKHAVKQFMQSKASLNDSSAINLRMLFEAAGISIGNSEDDKKFTELLNKILKQNSLNAANEEYRNNFIITQPTVYTDFVKQLIKALENTNEPQIKKGLYDLLQNTHVEQLGKLIKDVLQNSGLPNSAKQEYMNKSNAYASSLRNKSLGQLNVIELALLYRLKGESNLIKAKNEHIDDIARHISQTEKDPEEPERNDTMNKLIQRIRNLKGVPGPYGKREINLKSDHASRIMFKQAEYKNIQEKANQYQLGSRPFSKPVNTSKGTMFANLTRYIEEATSNKGLNNTLRTYPYADGTLTTENLKNIVNKLVNTSRTLNFNKLKDKIPDNVKQDFSRNFFNAKFRPENGKSQPQLHLPLEQKHVHQIVNILKTAGNPIRMPAHLAEQGGGGGRGGELSNLDQKIAVLKKEPPPFNLQRDELPNSLTLNQKLEKLKSTTSPSELKAIGNLFIAQLRTQGNSNNNIQEVKRAMKEQRNFLVDNVQKNAKVIIDELLHRPRNVAALNKAYKDLLAKLNSQRGQFETDMYNKIKGLIDNSHATKLRRKLTDVGKMESQLENTPLKGIGKNINNKKQFIETLKNKGEQKISELIAERNYSGALKATNALWQAVNPKDTKSARATAMIKILEKVDHMFTVKELKNLINKVPKITSTYNDPMQLQQLGKNEKQTAELMKLQQALGNPKPRGVQDALNFIRKDNNLKPILKDVNLVTSESLREGLQKILENDIEKKTRQPLANDRATQVFEALKILKPSATNVEEELKRKLNRQKKPYMFAPTHSEAVLEYAYRVSKDEKPKWPMTLAEYRKAFANAKNTYGKEFDELFYQIRDSKYITIKEQGTIPKLAINYLIYQVVKSTQKDSSPPPELFTDLFKQLPLKDYKKVLDKFSDGDKYLPYIELAQQEDYPKTTVNPVNINKEKELVDIVVNDLTRKFKDKVDKELLHRLAQGYVSFRVPVRTRYSSQGMNTPRSQLRTQVISTPQTQVMNNPPRSQATTQVSTGIDQVQVCKALHDHYYCTVTKEEIQRLKTRPQILLRNQVMGEQYASRVKTCASKDPAFRSAMYLTYPEWMTYPVDPVGIQQFIKQGLIKLPSEAGFWTELGVSTMDVNFPDNDCKKVATAIVKQDGVRVVGNTPDIVYTEVKGGMFKSPKKVPMVKWKDIDEGDYAAMVAADAQRVKNNASIEVDPERALVKVKGGSHYVGRFVRA